MIRHLPRSTQGRSSAASDVYKRQSKLYGDQVQAVIRENPYRLVEDIEGVGFLTADRIALSMGMAADSPHRIKCALKYVLQDAASSGGCLLYTSPSPRDS